MGSLESQLSHPFIGSDLQGASQASSKLQGWEQSLGVHFLHGAEVSLTLQRSSGDGLELLSDWDEPDWLWAQEIRQGWAACQLFATSGLWAGLQPSPREREVNGELA